MAERFTPVQHGAEENDGGAEDTVDADDIEIEDPMVVRDSREEKGVDGCRGAVNHCRGEGAAYEPFGPVSDNGEGEKGVEEDSLEEAVWAG